MVIRGKGGHMKIDKQQTLINIIAKKDAHLRKYSDVFLELKKIEKAIEVINNLNDFHDLRSEYDIRYFEEKITDLGLFTSIELDA